MYDGILLINKEKGWTSFDVVAKIRNILRNEIGNLELVNSDKTSNTVSPTSHLPSPKIKVGHTGTLDPLAKGLMIVVVGSYCKRAGEFSKLDKTYDVTMKLGETSTTGDEEGVKTKGKSLKIKEEKLNEALESFIGESMQTPPIFSAIKVGGKRAYDLARAGKDVALEPRPVTIHAIELTSYDYPFVNFTASVSSGTYIRSLVEDIGKQLGTGAYMSDLRRISIDKYDIKDALEISEVSSEKLRKV